MIIGLFGLSGSGKSHLSQDFKSKYPYFYCTSASTLLREASRPTSIHILDNVELDHNQKILSKLIQKLNLKYKNLFIELHAVIEEKNGKTYAVKEDILNSFQLDQVYILDIPPIKILQQRKLDKSKYRPPITLENLIKLQKLQNKILTRTFHNKVKTIKTLEELEFEIKKSSSLF
ncbi:ATP-binding protein [Acinetobacter variabilis]|uniref:ATP-binding protein n=1 Tax=Acinetobacter variabilis TaxID=70346 RepID=UPI003D782AB2